MKIGIRIINKETGMPVTGVLRFDAIGMTAIVASCATVLGIIAKWTVISWELIYPSVHIFQKIIP